MRKLALFFSLIFLVSCTPESSLSDASADSALEMRDEPDCNNFCALEDTSPCLTDFSFCSDLAGTRPFTIVLGAPPLAITGQREGGPLPFVVDFCEPPDSHPWTFRGSGGFVGPNVVFVSQYMGKLRSVTFEACFRPYIDPSFDPFPLPQPFPYEMYPAGSEASGQWELVAANGDVLRLFLEGTGYPNCDNPIQYLIKGYWMVVGGTGRFANATGGGCLEGSGPANPFDPNPPVDAPWTLEGGIDL